MKLFFQSRAKTLFPLLFSVAIISVSCLSGKKSSRCNAFSLQHQPPWTNRQHRHHHHLHYHVTFFSMRSGGGSNELLSDDPNGDDEVEVDVVPPYSSWRRSIHNASFTLSTDAPPPMRKRKQVARLARRLLLLFWKGVC